MISERLQKAAKFAMSGELHKALGTLEYSDIFEIDQLPRSQYYSEELGADEVAIRPVFASGNMEVYFYLHVNLPQARVYVCRRNASTGKEEEAFLDLSSISRPGKLTLGLCQGRHEIPGILGYVFKDISDPTDFAWMKRRAQHILEIWAGFLGPYKTDPIYVRVTGLTAALVAVINACYGLGVHLCLEHYDRETGEYLEQKVLPDPNNMFWTD